MQSFCVWFMCLAVAHVVQPAAIFNPDANSKNVLYDSVLVDQNEEVTRDLLNIAEYERERKDLLKSERGSGFGSEIILNEKEEVANKIIMAAKEDELNIGFEKPHLFNPSRHIFEVLDVVKESKLFQIIQKMPKGGILHAHETAMCSADYVVSLTYWQNLWQRTSGKSNEIKEFIFSREQPKNKSNNDVWRLCNDVRTEMGAKIYDEHVRKLFTLFDKNIDPRIQFKDINDVWQRMGDIFRKVTPIVTYIPVRKAYYKQALKEMHDDGVQYLEFRSSLVQVELLIINKIFWHLFLSIQIEWHVELSAQVADCGFCVKFSNYSSVLLSFFIWSFLTGLLVSFYILIFFCMNDDALWKQKLYDLDGNDYLKTDIVDIFMQTVDEFKRDNPLFIGSKMIYAPGKKAANQTVANYFDNVRLLHDKYPQFLVGFDLVGQEDISPGLFSFAEEILKLPTDLKFFFHAGETNWYGSVDENLVISILN